MPKVSIIIPTYNRAEFLEKTLFSLFQQTFQDFEIIVIDDGTPNDKNKILCEDLNKVKYIKIKNSGGPAKPRNIGLQVAAGDYIAFVDDDDLWIPQKLEKQIKILENNKDFGLIHSCCQVISLDDSISNDIIGRPGNVYVKHGDVSLKMIGNWSIMTPSVMVRKQIIDKVGFFNEDMPPAGEDMEYWIRCSFETKFYYLDEPLVFYRIHESNISSNTKKYLDLPLFLKKIADKILIEKRIDKKSFNLIINSICQFQIRTIKGNFLKTIKNLFKINPFWFIGKNNMKMVIYVLFLKNELNQINKK